MPLSKELFDDSEIEAAVLKISNHCNSRGCVSCRLYLKGENCLLMNNCPADWKSVLDDEKEAEIWIEIQQEKNGRKENY